MLYKSLVRRLAGSGRVAALGPSSGGAGLRTACTYAMSAAFAGSLFYVFVIVGGKPILGEWQFALKKRFPWLDRSDPDEME